MRKRVSRATFRQVIHIEFADKFFGFLFATKSRLLGLGQGVRGFVGLMVIRQDFYLGKVADM
jgi:hypothetical protein